MQNTHAKILESCIEALPPSDMDDTMLISLGALDDEVSELKCKLALMEGAVEEERGRCILAMWRMPWPSKGHTLESYTKAINKSLNQK